MNSKTLRLIGIVTAVLIAALFLVETGDDAGTPTTGQLLLPDFRATANDVNRVEIKRAGQESVIINKIDNRWQVSGRGNYPARTGVVRAVLLSLADARLVEAKTANPDLHARLGVDEPVADESKGIMITASADNVVHAVVFGVTAQGDYRYARVAGDNQSWLIDQNPDIPSTIGEWLEADIIDIDASRIKAVTIRHTDGEVVQIDKFAEEDTDFRVADIPDGRELSYSTVANGIGGALNDLDLDDVRVALPIEDAVTTEFQTFDGLTIVARTIRTDEENWISFDVSGAQSEEEIELSGRIGGWQYKVADYKANLLTRRWEDILKPVEE